MVANWHKKILTHSHVVLGAMALEKWNVVHVTVMEKLILVPIHVKALQSREDVEDVVAVAQKIIMR